MTNGNNHNTCSQPTTIKATLAHQSERRLNDGRRCIKPLCIDTHTPAPTPTSTQSKASLPSTTPSSDSSSTSSILAEARCAGKISLDSTKENSRQSTTTRPIASKNTPAGGPMNSMGKKAAIVVSIE